MVARQSLSFFIFLLHLFFFHLQQVMIFVQDEDESDGVSMSDHKKVENAAAAESRVASVQLR